MSGTARTLWATAEEALDHFFATTLAIYDFRVYDEFDNGEFVTGAKVDLIERGTVVATETFCVSSEDAPGDGFSGYGNGLDNNATTHALSCANSWVESRETPMEERFAPFGSEWQAEMQAEGMCV